MTSPGLDTPALIQVKRLRLRKETEISHWSLEKRLRLSKKII
jgi:hypothetical protein